MRRAVKVPADLKTKEKITDKDQEGEATGRRKRRLLLWRLAWTLAQWQFYQNWMVFSQSEKENKELWRPGRQQQIWFASLDTTDGGFSQSAARLSPSLPKSMPALTTRWTRETNQKIWRTFQLSLPVTQITYQLLKKTFCFSLLNFNIFERVVQWLRVTYFWELCDCSPFLGGRWRASASPRTGVTYHSWEQWILRNVGPLNIFRSLS